MFLFFLFDTSYTYEPFQGKTFVSSIWQYFSSSVLAQKLCWTWRLFLQLLFIACITTIPQMVRLHLCQVLCKKNIKQAHLPPPPAPSTPSPTSQFPVSCNHFRIPLFLFVCFLSWWPHVAQALRILWNRKKMHSDDRVQAFK